MSAEAESLESGELTEFLRIVEGWRKRWKVGEHAVYRGHADTNWVLVAKLFRDPDAKAVNSMGDDPDEVEKQLVGEHLKKHKVKPLERRLFHEFGRYLYAHRPDLGSIVPEEDRSSTRAMLEWRQLALAQHYGLPTRLLDFTTNPLVALFFAVEGGAKARTTTKGKWEEQNSAVWCVDVPNRRKVWEVWQKGGVWLAPLDFADQDSDPPIKNFVDTAFVPESFDERIRAQGSVFMCEPSGKKESFRLHVNLRDKKEAIIREAPEEKKSTATLKITVPREHREALREQLDLVGINRATLFPDLASAAKYLTWRIYERQER